jgi:hypothetical protein
MPLLQHPYFEYDGRKTMRSLADALTKLRELGNLSDGEDVEIKTMGHSVAGWAAERHRIGLGTAPAGWHQEGYFHALVCDLFGENHRGGPSAVRDPET